MTVTLETERLVLRPMQAGDADAHIAMMQHPQTAEHLSDTGKPRGRAAEWSAVAFILGHWQLKGFGFFSVFEKSTDRWIGRVGPWQPEGWPAIEVGWSINVDMWGNGYAPEATLATMQWVFEKFPTVNRLISGIGPDNKNSQAVARKVGEAKTDKKFHLAGNVLEVWTVERQSWFEKFGK